MDINEKISVMQAFAEGKPIEFREKSDNEVSNWRKASAPSWNWYEFDYRVKPEVVWVPYDNVQEIDREYWLRAKDTEDILCSICMIDTTDNRVYVTNYGWQTLEQLFDKFLYEDGSLCGKVHFYKEATSPNAKDIDIPGGRFA